MKRIALLIILLTIYNCSYAQRIHPRDKEIEAAILSYFTNLDSILTLNEFKYIESTDISEKEYLDMASRTFEATMLVATHMLKTNGKKQKEYQQKRAQHKKSLKLYKLYSDTVKQLQAEGKQLEDMYNQNKISFDSCVALVKTADSVTNFGYLSFAVVSYRDKQIPDSEPIKNEVNEFIVTKDLEVHVYMRPKGD